MTGNDDFSSPGKWHATQWPGFSSCNGGSSVLQRSRAIGHLGW
jgi:hypothetical protein